VKTNSQFLEPIPARDPFLYKYGRLEEPRHLDWLKQIILGNEVYFPLPNELNDPQEAKPRIIFGNSPEAAAEVTFKYWAEARTGMSDKDLAVHKNEIIQLARKHGAEFLAKPLRSNFLEHIGKYRLYSLSKRPDNANLWRKYSVHQRGYCLKFRNSGPLFSRVFEVRYQKSLVMDLSDDSQLQAYFLYYKTLKWIDEEEVRILMSPGPGATAFDPAVLLGIILGKRIAPCNEQLIREWAAQRSPSLMVEKQKNSV
jgi:hypothetical protein